MSIGFMGSNQGPVGKTQKVFPREAAEKTGAQRQTQGRVPLLLS